MSNLLTCLGSCDTNHNYTLTGHAVSGTCQFIQNSASVIEIKGQATIAGLFGGPFDIIITDGSGGQPVLTVNRTKDPKATLSGCTVQAHSTLLGKKFTVSPNGGQNSMIHTPWDVPNIEIVY